MDVSSNCTEAGKIARAWFKMGPPRLYSATVGQMGPL
jgi:hypothetical protein